MSGNLAALCDPARVRKLIVSAWKEVPVPDAATIVEPPYQFEWGHAYEVFGGKRFDEFSVEEAIEGDFSYNFMTEVGMAYYSAPFLLAWLSEFEKNPRRSPSLPLSSLGFVTAVMAPFDMKSGSFTIEQQVAFAEFIMCMRSWNTKHTESKQWKEMEAQVITWLKSHRREFKEVEELLSREEPE